MALDDVYPVGSIFWVEDKSTDPNNIWPGSKWRIVHRLQNGITEDHDSWDSRTYIYAWVRDE